MREQLEALLDAEPRALAHANGAKVSIASLAACSGEATQWLVRGKKRGGFELTAEFALEATDPSGNAAKATLKLADVSGDDLDDLDPVLTWQDMAGNDADQRALREAAKGLTPTLAEVLGQLLEKIKTK